MASKTQKHKMLEQAILITREYGGGGYDKMTPEGVLEHVYNKLIELVDQIEKQDKD